MRPKTFLKLAGFAAITVLLLNSRSFNRFKVEEIPYPEGYRQWTHIKSGMVGPKSAAFDRLGGFYHIYANELAIEGYNSGEFPEGAMIAFDRLEMEETPDGTIKEGKRRLVDVMIKNSVAYDSTGGWGFEEFLLDSKTVRAVQSLSRTKCFNCHTRRKDSDFVFSNFRR